MSTTAQIAAGRMSDPGVVYQRPAAAAGPDWPTSCAGLTVANRITAARLAIALVSFVFMTFNWWQTAFLLIFMATILDIVDGQAARRLHQVSKQGVFLDIMVDKIVIISTFLFIGVSIDVLFFYLGILMLVREYMMDTMRALAASNSIVITADKLSKIKGILFMTAMLTMIGNQAFVADPWPHAVLRTAGIVLAIAGLLLAYVSLARCLIRHRTNLA